MHAHEDTDERLTDLERRLLGWRPAGTGLDRDKMLFEAGRASARSQVRERAWVGALAASMLVMLGLGTQLVREHAWRLDLEHRLIARAQPAPPAPSIAELPIPPIVAEPDSYLVLTHRMLAGLDEPPSYPRSPSKKPTGTRPERPLSPRLNRGSEGLIDL